MVQTSEWVSERTSVRERAWPEKQAPVIASSGKWHA
jgi:hypothetical protein